MAKSMYKGVFDATKSYPVYSIVQMAEDVDILMISVQEVPVGSDITDANFWIKYNVSNVNMLGTSGGVTEEEVQEMIETYVGLIEELDFEADDIVDAINYLAEHIVQANWNETDTDSMAYIQNKPTIPPAQVQANWDEVDTTDPSYIQNKPTIPTPYVLPTATDNNLGGVKVGNGLNIDANGVLSAISAGDNCFKVVVGETTETELIQAMTAGKLCYFNDSVTDIDYLEYSTFVMGIGIHDGAEDIGEYNFYACNSLADATEHYMNYAVVTLGPNSQGILSVIGSAILKPVMKVEDSDIDSENATSGKVLTANGSGGASWETVGGGSNVQANWNETDPADDSFIQNKPFDTVTEVNVYSGSLEYSTRDTSDMGHTAYGSSDTPVTIVNSANIGDTIIAEYGNTTITDTIIDGGSFGFTKISADTVPILTGGTYTLPAIIYIESSQMPNGALICILDDTLPSNVGDTISVTVKASTTSKLGANKINIGKGLINDNGTLVSKSNRVSGRENTTNSITLPLASILNIRQIDIQDAQSTSYAYIGEPILLPAVNEDIILKNEFTPTNTCKLAVTNIVIDPIYQYMITYEVTEFTWGGTTYTSSDIDTIDIYYDYIL